MHPMRAEHRRTLTRVSLELLALIDQAPQADWSAKEAAAIKEQVGLLGKRIQQLWRSVPLKVPKPKPVSRGTRWSSAATDALAALEQLEEVRQEYEDWRDSLPENLQNSSLGDKLNTVADLDIQGAIDTVQEADGADLPQGFGRD